MHAVSRPGTAFYAICRRSATERNLPMWTPLCAWTLAATFPSTAALPGLDRIDPRPFVDQLRRESPVAIRFVMVLSALVFLATPVLTIGIPLPAAWLSPARLDQHAQALATHRIYLLRQAMLMIKTLGGLCWGADPAVRAALAKDGAS